MSIQRVLVKSIAAAASLLVLGIILAAVTDFGMFRDKAEQIVSDSLDREFSIDGAFHVSLFPTPTVRAEGVRIGNTEWAAGDDFLAIKKLSLEFDLWSAISPPFRIVKLNIDGISLDVELREDGSGNWPTGDASASDVQATDGPLSDSLLLGNIEISEYAIAFREAALPDEPIAISGDMKLEQSADSEFIGHIETIVEGPAITEQLAPLGGMAVEAISDFALNLGKAETVLRLDGLVLRVGESDLSGRIDVSSGEQTVVVTATLVSETLVLVDVESEEKAAPAEDSLLFSNETSFFDAVRDFPAELEIDLKVNEIRQDDSVTASDLRSSLSIRPGELNVDPLQAQINGGSVTAEYVMTSTNDSGTVLLNVIGQGIKMAEPQDTGADTNDEPPVDLSIRITGIGRTPHAIASSANGDVSVDIASGRSLQGDVGFLANDVLAEMFSGMGEEDEEVPFTDVECGLVRATIVDGKIDVGTLLIKTSDLVITGSGSIDLEAETIDIGFNTKAREGLGIAAAGLVTPFIKLGGSLRQPAVAVDAPSALLAGGLAVATGGVSLLGKEVLDRVVSEAADCSAPESPL